MSARLTSPTSIAPRVVPQSADAHAVESNPARVAAGAPAATVTARALADSGGQATIAAALTAAVRALAGGCSDSPRLDAELLLGKVLGLSRAALIVRGAESLPADSRRAFDDLIDLRLGGAPVAYLTGTREFWSLQLQVTPEVLVPRPETELLVEHTLALLPDGMRSVLDLGTGSGAVALAIAAERPHARITGVDLSDRALEVARANAAQLGARGAQIRWRQGAWFDAVPGERFDLIVANPPYVAADDPALEKLAAEPALALTPGPTGLESLAAIVEGAGAHLRPQGWLLLEHGSTQAAAVARLLERRGFTAIRSHVDYSGKPRITLGTLHSAP